MPHLLQKRCGLVVFLVDAQILKVQTRSRSFQMRYRSDRVRAFRVVFPAGEAGSCLCVCVRVCVFQAPFESN